MAMIELTSGARSRRWPPASSVSPSETSRSRCSPAPRGFARGPLQARGPARVDLDAPALGAEPRDRLGDEGERLALALGAIRSGAPLRRQRRGRAARRRARSSGGRDGRAAPRRMRPGGRAPRLELALALKRHHTSPSRNVGFRGGRQHEAAAVVEVEPERRQHEGRADRSSARDAAARSARADAGPASEQSPAASRSASAAGPAARAERTQASATAPAASGGMSGAASSASASFGGASKASNPKAPLARST